MNLDKKNIKKILFVVCGAILFYSILQNVSAVAGGFLYLVNMVAPFLLGLALAFILNVPMKLIEKHLFKKTKNERLQHIRRPLAYLLTLVLVVTIIFTAVFVVVPELGATLANLVKQVPKAIEQFLKWVESLPVSFPQMESILANIRIDWQQLIQKAGAMLQSGATGVFNSGVGIVSGVLSGVTTFFIGFVFSIYVLFQKEKLSHQGKLICYALCEKNVADKLMYIAKLSNKTFSSFLSGQCVEAVILGGLFVLTMTLLKLPYALLIGVLIAVTALIPMVGAFIGCAIGAFLIIMVNPMQALVFIILFLILQQIEGNLIYPYVVGNSVGLPSLWVLVAVTIGGKLMGVIGMLIFIPLCSVAYALFRDYIKKRLTTKHITNEVLIAEVIAETVPEMETKEPKNHPNKNLRK